jgi:Mn-dependent DtxR family transcriptional regulator
MRLTAEQAARLLEVSRATVYRMLKGRLKNLELKTIVEYIKLQAYKKGRHDMLDELKRQRKLRRRDHHAVRSCPG